MGSFLKPMKVPLDGIPSLQQNQKMKNGFSCLRDEREFCLSYNLKINQ